MKGNFNSWTRRVLACVVCGVFAVGMVWAERVSEEDAALVANNFMNVRPSSVHGQKAPAKRMVMKAAAAAEENQFYIYENADGEGWVMVAANDVVRPILAYSETGHFRTDNMPRNVKGWLQSYNKQIKYVAENTSEASIEVQTEWIKLRKGARKAKATEIVKPLIKTGWDQDSPYWNLCPKKGNNYCYTGCVATAMAQVMNYWQWPKQGTGSHTIPETSYSANFGETTYDWTNMQNTYNGSETSAQKTAVATLMYHCGVAVDMEYGTAQEGGSGAYTIDYNGYWSSQNIMCAETALKQFFGYKSSTVKGYDRNGYVGSINWTKSKWTAMLKEELDAARPIMYAGVGCDDPNDDNTCYGHSFVCDGYDSDDYFHFNWGWSNWCDGYYDVDAMETTDPGSGGGNGVYNLQQDVIIGIQPPITGHAVVKNATGCTISSANSANNNEAFTATITPTDATYDFTSLSVTLGSTTLTKTTHYTLSNDNKTLTIKASAITGDNSNDLTITVVWTKNRYKYELLGENCDPEMDEGMLAKNAALQLTITPTNGYTLSDAACWDVSMGGNTLTYGTGFTYEGTTFKIASVTGDVEIYVYGSKAVNWMSNGKLFATTMTVDNKYVLPTTTPDIDCEGREFYGWCATAEITDAPKTVKNGDAATETTTFYAVFAKKGTAGTLFKLVSTLTNGKEYVFVTRNTAGSGYAFSSAITTGTSVSIETSGDDKIVSGTPTDAIIWTVTTGYKLTTNDETKTNRELKINGSSISLASSGSNLTWTTSYGLNGESNSGSTKYYLQCSNGTFSKSTTGSQTNRVWAYEKSEGGTSYSNFTTTCAAPCEGELTDITLNTTNVKKVFTEGEAFTYDGLVVTANYDVCDSKTVTPTSVSTPNMNQIGKQDVTVTYEGKNATYEITINALPTYTIRFFNGGELMGEPQVVKEGSLATKPSPDPTAACEGYTFYGWWTDELDEDNTTAQKVTNFKATKDQDYYAIYSKTVDGGLTNNYQKITTLDELTTGNYVVAGNGSRAMKNEIYNYYYFYTVSVTPSSNIISNPAANIIWNITRSNNTVSFYNEAVKQYAYLYKSGNFYDLGLRESEYVFNVSVSGGNWTFEASDYSDQYMVYYIYTNNKNNTTAYEFAAKSSSSTSIYLYKQQNNSTTYYTSTVNCGGTTDVENTNAEQVAVKALMNGQIVIIRGEAVYSITGVRIQ